jgi:hypothetical protein
MSRAGGVAVDRDKMRMKLGKKQIVRMWAGFNFLRLGSSDAIM